MTSEKYFKKLMKESGAKQRRSLENIKKVCDLMEESGIEITIASVGRELKRLGLSPRVQTIRNNPTLKKYTKKRKAFNKNTLVIKQENILVKQLIKENKALKKMLLTKFSF